MREREREGGLGSAKSLWLGLEEASSGYGPCLSCLDIWTNALEHMHLLTSPNWVQEVGLPGPL